MGGESRHPNAGESNGFPAAPAPFLDPARDRIYPRAGSNGTDSISGASDPGHWSPVSPLAKRLLIVFGALFVLYAIAGFFVAPGIVRSQILTNLDRVLTTKARLERVRVNPLALSVTLERFAIPESSGTTAVAFDKLYLRFSVFSPFFRAWTLDELRIEKPGVNVAVLEDRSLSLMGLVRPLPSAAPADTAAEPPAILIRKLRVVEGTASYEDRTRTPPLHKALIPIRISLTDFTTRRDRNNAYSFDASTDQGEQLAWHGRFRLRPFVSDGELRVQGLLAKTIEDFLGPERPFEFRNGTITFRADYRADASATPPVFQLSRMGVRIRDLELADRATGETSIRAGAVDTKDGTFRSDLFEANLGTVTADSLGVLVWMDSTGVTNLQRWSKAPPDTARPVTNKIAALSFQGLTFEFQDRRLSPPGVFRVREGHGEVKGYSSAPGAKASVTAACSLSTDGYAKATGTLVPSAGSVDVNVEADRVQIPDFESFVSPFARLTLQRGTVGAKGRLRFNDFGPAGPMLRFAGEVASSRFAAADAKLGKEFLSWDKVQVRGLQYDMAPNRVVIREIVADKPYLRFVVAPDLTTNVQSIAVPPDSVPAAFRPKPDQPDTIPMAIESIVVRNASMYFADLSLTPNFATGIHTMNGSIRELSSSRAAHAVIDIDGKVDEFAPVKISGLINPLNSRGLTDVGVSFKNIELTTFTPYSGKFMGYRIERGKLDLDLNYAIQDRELKGENKILVRQFTLGDKVESKEATSLPVKFAIALLKDKNGDIDLDLPVHGNLDDPKFSIGRIIVKVLVQLVVKAVTSPFKLFGAIFGGDGEEVAPAIRFPYGSAELDTTETRKLDAIQKGLSDRPGLKIEVESGGYPPRDSLAVLDRRFLERVRAAGAAPGRAQRPDPGLVAAAAGRAPAGFTPFEYAQGLASAYSSQFGKLPSVEKPPGKRPPAGTPDPELLAAEGRRLDVIEGRVRSSIALRPDDFTTLPTERARRIQGYLLQDSTLTADRVFIVADKGAYSPDSAGVRCGMTLRD